ncbi:MAG: family 78 glycoside hydrolase catalytic domain [Erysipelotrichaceae bacterium]
MIAVNLKTEYLTNPIGIDITTPIVSWTCKGGIKQTAYEIIAYKDKQHFWTSGKVKSNNMFAKITKPAESKNRITWKVRLWDENDIEGNFSIEAYYEMGLLESELWQAKWINPEIEEKNTIQKIGVRKPASYLKKNFVVKKVEDSRLYITAHGLYEAFINNKRVGNFVLAPGSFNYDKRIGYQSYDVTNLLVEGNNIIEVILGDGWYRSDSGIDGERNIYGTDVALIAQLEIDKEVICITDETWLASQNGPLLENDMQQGEKYDARKELFYLDENNYHSIKIENFPKDNLCCSNALIVKEKESFKGELIQTPDGNKVIDFSQNLAGYIEFTINAYEGQIIKFLHGETLDENGNFTQENFQDRKRHKEGGIRQEVIYICKEGENYYKTKFSIWGFRYCLIETDIDLSSLNIKAIAVYSDMQETAEFKCSNQLVNKLFENCMWSMKSNFTDIPTDCPTRERAGWTGDMAVFIETGLLLADCYTIVRKWLKECELTQYSDGKIAMISPRNNNISFFSKLLSGSVGWGDACIIVPYTMYKNTKDDSILRENYQMMKKWYRYLIKRANKSKFGLKNLLKFNSHKGYIITTGIDYGEWCEPDIDNMDVMRTPQSKVATAYLARSGKLLSEIAKIIGKYEEASFYKGYSKKAKEGFRCLALEEGRIKTDRQAELVRAISFDLLTEEEKNTAAKDLNNLVIGSDYHLNTGFLSTPKLCEVLAEYGYVETAYKLLLQETYPSWLYAVKKGATTIWEKWDGIDENNKPTASLNHYSKGAIAGWLIKGICGINIKKGQLIIKPTPHRLLKHASATCHSVLGKITSSWNYDEKGLIKYELEIPSNVTCKFILPDGEEKTLHCGKHSILAKDIV